MALYYDLNVFKDVYKLILLVFEATKVFPRENKYPPGQDMKEACFVTLARVGLLRSDCFVSLAMTTRQISTSAHQHISTSTHQHIIKSTHH
ncbi:MAG: hypothetical protein K8F24_01425 [Bacteroidales bacterium]|nr:hypothetical protein [Bacteroidales bacterium]